MGSMYLLTNGYAHENVISWDDEVVYLTVDGECVALITWRNTKWRKVANITIGYVAEAHRRKGYYRKLWEYMVSHIKENDPEIVRIETGHHVNNEVSQTMQERLGRKPAFVTYEYAL